MKTQNRSFIWNECMKVYRNGRINARFFLDFAGRASTVFRCFGDRAFVQEATVQKARSVMADWRRLYPFKPHHLNLNGLRYHYLDEGHGPPVVMVHGNPTWSFYYRSLVTALSPHMRVIVPDHIGCGLSDKPGTGQYDFRLRSRIEDLGALIDHLGLGDNISFVVHDWGGAIGLAWAAQHPDRTAGLVLLNTSAFIPKKMKGLPVRLALIRNIRIMATPAVLGLNLFARGAALMAPARRLSPEAKAGLVAPYNNWRNRLATLKFVQDIPLDERDPSFSTLTDISDRLAHLAGLPMMICWGERDFVFTPLFLDEWVRRFPGAEVHRFPRAGHYILEDQPDEVSALAVDFFKRRVLKESAAG